MVALNDAEKVSLDVIAMARLGLLPQFDCSTCTKEMQESRNCGGGNAPFSFYHPLITFTACPLQYLGPTMHETLDRMDYLSRYEASAKDYDEVNPRLWLAIKYYETRKKLIEDSVPKKKAEGEDDPKAKLRGLFK